jgi:hypothetical protein
MIVGVDRSIIVTSIVIESLLTELENGGKEEQEL